MSNFLTRFFTIMMPRLANFQVLRSKPLSTNGVSQLLNVSCNFQVEPRDILDYGVIPELAGRIPVVVTLDSLTQVTPVRVCVWLCVCVCVCECVCLCV